MSFYLSYSESYVLTQKIGRTRIIWSVLFSIEIVTTGGRGCLRNEHIPDKEIYLLPSLPFFLLPLLQPFLPSSHIFPLPSPLPSPLPPFFLPFLPSFSPSSLPSPLPPFLPSVLSISPPLSLENPITFSRTTFPAACALLHPQAGPRETPRPRGTHGFLPPAGPCERLLAPLVGRSGPRAPRSSAARRSRAPPARRRWGRAASARGRPVAFGFSLREPSGGSPQPGTEGPVSTAPPGCEFPRRPFLPGTAFHLPRLLKKENTHGQPTAAASSQKNLQIIWGKEAHPQCLLCSLPRDSLFSSVA